MPKRSPIEYKPQFGGGMFRSREEVESERAAVEEDDVAAREQSNTSVDERTVERSNGRTVEIMKDVSPPRANGRTNERTNERTRVRHSFDVGRDQLLALSAIQSQIFGATGKKPKLGDLVQDALDLYIARHNGRTNERTNER